MFPLIYRHNGYWGAPAGGFGFCAPTFFEPRPMHHMHCGNPFMSFMGGFMGGFATASLFGGGGSYVSYPSPAVSVFPSPYPAYQGYSGYQGYSAGPMSSFGYDYSALAFNESYGRFLDSFAMPRYASTPMPTSNWSAPAQTSNWSTPVPSKTWSQPFSSLTQSGRSSHEYSLIPPRAKSQTSAQGGGSQAKTAVSANQTQQTSSTTAGVTSVNTTVPQEASIVLPTISPAQLEEPIKMQSLVPFKQRYDQILANLDATVSKDRLEKDSPLNAELNAQMVLCFKGIKKIDSKGVEPDNAEKEILNKKMNELSEMVAKCQKKHPLDNTSPKTKEQLIVDEATFNSSCKGGDCGDYNDRLYYDTEKSEWVKSTKKGYPKQPIAPESTLVEIPEQYTTDKSGIKYHANPEALKHFIEMSDVSFAQRGIQLTVNSSYRRFKDQEKEFEADKERIRRAKADGYNPIPKAAPPGYSEHHTGYPFDIGDSSPINVRNDRDFLTDKNGEFVLKDGKRIPVSAHSKWLEKNAKIFGFEMSYPPDNKLGVLAEGWHYRFNPELCEKYKKEREELVGKYIAGESETVKG